MNRRELLKTIPALAIGGARGDAADESAANKARLRNAICAYSYRDELKNKTMTYADLVRIAVETGADGLDLTVYWMPENPPDDFLLPLRRLAYKNAVEIYSLSIRTDMCRPTRELQDVEVAEVKKWVDVAEKLGAGHIRVFGGRAPKDATENQAAGYAVEVLKRCADYSARQGVILGLENHGGITEKAARIIQIVKQVDSPWVGINLDTGNFNANVFPQIEMCIPYAVKRAGEGGDAGRRRDARAGRLGPRRPDAGERRLPGLPGAGIRSPRERGDRGSAPDSETRRDHPEARSGVALARAGTRWSGGRSTMPPERTSVAKNPG